MGFESTNDSFGYMGLIYRNYDYTTSNNIILSFSDVYEVQIIRKKIKEEKITKKETTRITKTKRIKLIKLEEEETIIKLLVAVRSKLE